MDVQMPVMDGLAATQLIRKLEGSVRRVPIIALTASAMTDEVERCLAAGMNAVLAKPLEIGKLRELLEQHGFRAGGTAPAAAPEEPAPAPPATNPLDLDQLRGIVGDDSDFLKELCDTFVSSSARIVEDMGQALSQGDSASLSSLAHKLKGGSSSVCAHELAKLAASLEKEAKEQPAQELAPAVAAVKRAFDAAAGYVASQVSA
jgi:two-component system sensor histidine kinase/response regulator